MGSRRGSSQAGLDWSAVGPITPGKALPGLDSFSAIVVLIEISRFMLDEFLEGFAAGL